MKVTLHGHYGGAKAIEVDAELPDDRTGLCLATVKGPRS